MSKHESHVSFDTAKQLKAVGFDWECPAHYNKDGEFILHGYESDWNANATASDNLDIEYYSAPTLDVAQRWLREVKGVYLDIDTHFNSAGVWFSYVINVLDSDAKFGTYSNCLGAGHSFNEHKEAKEEGIKKALEIMLEKGE